MLFIIGNHYIVAGIRKRLLVAIHDGDNRRHLQHIFHLNDHDIFFGGQFCIERQKRALVRPSPGIARRHAVGRHIRQCILRIDVPSTGRRVFFALYSLVIQLLLCTHGGNAILQGKFICQGILIGRQAAGRKCLKGGGIGKYCHPLAQAVII